MTDDETPMDRGDKLRKILALEVDRIVEDLEFRREVLLELWGRHRDRGMFLDTVFTRWATLGFPDLLDLEPSEVAVLDTFYRELHELRFYFRFTEDMPVTLSDTYDIAIRRLKAYGDLVLDALGGPPERPMIEFDDEEGEDEDPAIAGSGLGPFALTEGEPGTADDPSPPKQEESD